MTYHPPLLPYRAVITAGPVRTLSLLFQLASDGIATGVLLLALLEPTAVTLLVVLDAPVAAMSLQLQLGTIIKMSKSVAIQC